MVFGYRYILSYLSKIVKTKINLQGFDTKFTIKWYKPGTGGSLQKTVSKKWEEERGDSGAALRFRIHKLQQEIAIQNYDDDSADEVLRILAKIRPGKFPHWS